MVVGVIVFAPIGRGVLYWALFALVFVLFALWRVMEESVSRKAVKAALGATEFFSVKSGMVKVNGNRADLVKGVVAVYSGMVFFLVRAKATGGAKIDYSFDTAEISTYTLGKVDDFHAGITFALAGGEEVKFTGKEWAKSEKSLREALGWPEEGVQNPES